MDPILQQILAFAQAHGLDPRAVIAQMGGGGGSDPTKPAAPAMQGQMPMQMGMQGQGRMPSGPVGVAMPQGMAQGMPAGMPAPQGISMGMPRDDRMGMAPMPGAQINAEAGKASFLTGKAPPSAITAKEGITGAGGAGGSAASMAGLASLGLSLLSSAQSKPAPPPPDLKAYRGQRFQFDPNLLTGLFQ